MIQSTTFTSLRLPQEIKRSRDLETTFKGLELIGIHPRDLIMNIQYELEGFLQNPQNLRVLYLNEYLTKFEFINNNYVLDMTNFPNLSIPLKGLIINVSFETSSQINSQNYSIIVYSELP